MKKTDHIHIKIDPETKAQLMEKAAKENRNLSNFMIMASMEYKNESEEKPCILITTPQ